MYNTNKNYFNTYQQKIEEKAGFYDKLWKTYLQKEKITNCIESLYVNNIIPKHIKGKVILEIIFDKTGVPVNIPLAKQIGFSGE